MDGNTHRLDSGQVWIDDLVVMLCGGDITRRDAIQWGFTLRDVKPYAEYRSREIRFREAVIRFLCGPDKKDITDKYCENCRRAGRDIDCATCPKTICVMDQEGKE